MEKELVEQLERSLTQIQNAFVKGNRESKEEAYKYAKSHVLGLQEDLDARWNAWCEEGIGRYYYPCDVSFMNDFSLNLNLRFCYEVISERMRANFSSPISPNAMQLLFFSPEPLQQDTVLYEEKNEDGEEKRLKFSDFLSVLSYADKFVKANFGGDKDKYNNSLMALKTVDLAINHKPVDKPLNKTLHLVNDILTECAKAFHQDKETKRTTSGISLLVDLAIDFLVRN